MGRRRKDRGIDREIDNTRGERYPLDMTLGLRCPYQPPVNRRVDEIGRVGDDLPLHSPMLPETLGYDDCHWYIDDLMC